MREKVSEGSSQHNIEVLYLSLIPVLFYKTLYFILFSDLIIRSVSGDS